MVIHINTTIPIQELSEQQKRFQIGQKIQIRNNYLERNQERIIKKQKNWTSNNKDHLGNYREENREKIRNQYKSHMNKKYIATLNDELPKNA